MKVTGKIRLKYIRGFDHLETEGLDMIVAYKTDKQWFTRRIEKSIVSVNRHYYRHGYEDDEETFETLEEYYEAVEKYIEDEEGLIKMPKELILEQIKEDSDDDKSWNRKQDFYDKVKKKNSIEFELEIK